MNTQVGIKAKNDFEKDFFKLMNSSVIGKTMENLTKHRNIKLVTTEKEETIWCRNQIIIAHIFSQKILEKSLVFAEGDGGGGGL